MSDGFSLARVEAECLDASKKNKLGKRILFPDACVDRCELGLQWLD